MVLPTLTLAAWSLAVITRMTRSALLEVVDSDYHPHRAQPRAERSRVILRHALPNACR